MKTEFNIKKGRTYPQTFTLVDDRGPIDLTTAQSVNLKVTDALSGNSRFSVDLDIVTPQTGTDKGKVSLAWLDTYTSSAPSKNYGEFLITWADGTVLPLPEQPEAYVIFNFLPSNH